MECDEARRQGTKLCNIGSGGLGFRGFRGLEFIGFRGFQGDRLDAFGGLWWWVEILFS